MSANGIHRCRLVAGTLLLAAAVCSCSTWRGANSLPLPGTEGGGNGAYTVQAQLPDVDHIERNSRVRVADATVGNVVKIERQGWHALVTMSINGDVKLPANATAAVGQTSLLGSLHIELAPPTDEPPEGQLTDGSVIPLSRGSAYPSTEQALAAVSLLLNQGGIGNIHDITQALSTAFAGRQDDVRSLIGQLDQFTAYLNDQSDDIIGATDSLNRLVGQFAEQRPVVDRALQSIPEALGVLRDKRKQLADALVSLGQFSALAHDTTTQTRDNLVKELKDLGPVLESLANAGPALTRSLGYYTTLPFPKDTIDKWVRGDYANLTAIVDLTLSRLDAGLFTGTRFEGNLTELEMQWGRTIGQMPSPYTAGNPLVAPYHWYPDR
jgi:phospholipid/cholesterol/gamma-HCH transport system substrate-binding protein